MSSTTPSSQDQDEHDALSAFRLRTRTSHYKFVSSGLWKCMQDAKWKHKNNDDIYDPPPSIDNAPSLFAGLKSKELQAQLDRFAIPPITNSTLKAFPTPPHLSERDAELRNDLLTRFYYKGQKTSSRKHSRQEDTHVNEEEKQDDAEEKKQEDDETASSKKKASSKKGSNENKQDDETSTRRKLRSRQPQNNKNASATSFEKGADMYLTKKKKPRKTNHVEVEQRIQLDMPLPSKCVAELEPKNAAPPPDFLTSTELDDCSFLLSTNHSLLFHGFGSKRCVLNALAKRLKQEGDVLTIDGYDREVCMDDILDIIVNLFLKGTEPKLQGASAGITTGTHDLIKRSVAISHQLRASREKPLYLVLHNVDGVGLRHGVIQQALAALVSNSTVAATGTRAVRLVASIDHVNAVAAMWNLTALSNFAWVWKEVHTYQPYYQEIKLGFNDKDFKKSKSTSLSSRRSRGYDEDSNLSNVLTSLAPRHAEALQVLARLQLDSKSGQRQAVDYVTWRNHCKLKMVAQSDSVLRVYLNELGDHGIIEVIVDEHAGTERVLIPHSNEKLHEILGFEIQKMS